MSNMGIVLSDADLAKVNELRRLREERKEIETLEASLRADILQVLDGAPQALNGSGAVAVSVTTQVRRNVDRTKLEALYPEVFEAVITESAVQIVKLP